MKREGAHHISVMHWKGGDIVRYATRWRKTCWQNSSQGEHSLCLEKILICQLQGGAPRRKAKTEVPPCRLRSWVWFNYSILLCPVRYWSVGLGRAALLRTGEEGVEPLLPCPHSLLPIDTAQTCEVC